MTDEEVQKGASLGYWSANRTAAYFDRSKGQWMGGGNEITPKGTNYFIRLTPVLGAAKPNLLTVAVPLHKKVKDITNRGSPVSGWKIGKSRIPVGLGFFRVS
jgi:hypothetical protein